MTMLSNGSTAGLVGQPAHRRFLSDMTDERGVIPAALLRYPELAALEEQRRRLVQALNDARDDGPPQMSEEQWVAARTKALRDGTEPPPPLPPNAERQASTEQRRREEQAVNEALLALADDICQTVREHPDYEKEGRDHIAALRKQADDLERQAADARREADAAGFLVQWLERVRHSELYVVTTPT